ncbi:hypothetical protein KBY65_13510 [Cyanobium sp. Alchichica 3B3-8F6]|uniref:hypothetical protein n=1 Tax=unclassified Cyanobium TaxID=2627006 RepID=UPI0020CE28A7|nr:MULTISPECIES: hypothetical protein [unclassified Cyanobium]MCP9883470.1 hypothetical protein [Cyanobium sp. Alchichica 3B3-8F6]MCP9941755.1 hypothetical protein [Cyanobium sp. ATX 6E8]
MTPPLIFVVAPATLLPEANTSLEDLQVAQALGPSSGFSLRIFNRGADHPDLGGLPVDGRLTGEQRRSSDGTEMLCDALILRIEPQHHWLGVYQGEPEEPTSLQCLDRVALGELSNATCWFYPTQDGTFLSWERDLRLSLQPGSIADCPEELASAPYERSRLSVLWSLLGDDASLTCVGLTYGGQRLDWPLRVISTEPMATWGRFRVDSQADHTLVVEDCLTVFPAPPWAA